MNELQKQKAEQFRKMHFTDEVLITPNAWDAVSAKIYELEGFKCIATTSAGIAHSLGKTDVERMTIDENLSVISLRQGTVCGYSPRMRLDLVVNTMFKAAMLEKQITVNNPSIWRPILAVKDAINAYIRAVESNEKISGIFNVASGNFTVGEIGDLVRSCLEQNLNMEIKLDIKHIKDYRNYKVSIDKARNILSFKPRHDIDSIVKDLIENYDSMCEQLNKFSDLKNEIVKSLKDK